MEVDSTPPAPEIPTLDYAPPAVQPPLQNEPGGPFGFLIAGLNLLTVVVAVSSIEIVKTGPPQFDDDLIPVGAVYAILGGIVGFFAGRAATYACIKRLRKSAHRLSTRPWGSLMAAIIYLSVAIPGCVLYVNHVDDMSLKMAQLCFVLLAGWLMFSPLTADRILLREQKEGLP